MPVWLVDLLKGWYRKAKAAVTTPWGRTRTFSLYRGVKQGSVMSPWLYSLFINGLLKKLKAEKLGVAFVGEWIGALAFADDIVLIAESAEEMARMVRVCEEYARRWRFEFNVKKCKYMIIDGDAMEEAIQIEGNEVERVNNFKYLGVWLSVWGGVGGNGKEQGRERQEQAGAVEGNVGIRKRQMDNGRKEGNVGGDRENSNGVRD